MMAGVTFARVRGACKVLLLTACTADSSSAETGPIGNHHMPGVEVPERAWQNYALNCQGCHRPDGAGSEKTAPPLAGVVATFIRVDGGREYLVQVPGVATSPVPDAELAELMNWMLWRFDGERMSSDFQPYTAAEVGLLRKAPLRTEASALREQLLSKAPATPEKPGRGLRGARIPNTGF